jgi:hypothetical protein
LTWSQSQSTSKVPYGGAAAAPESLERSQEFRAILRDLDLTPNVVWGLTKTDAEWAESLGGALEANRREDLEHGTNAAYVQGCVCSECRENQRIRMAKNR